MATMAVLASSAKSRRRATGVCAGGSLRATGHHLRTAVRHRRTVHWPRLGLLRHPHPPRAQGRAPHPRTPASAPPSSSTPESDHRVSGKLGIAALWDSSGFGLAGTSERWLRLAWLQLAAFALVPHCSP